MPSNPQRSRRIVREQLGRGVAGNPVHVAVGRHHAREPGLDHRRLEREELFVPQLTRTEVDGRLVEPALGQPVTDHVLAGGQHPVAEIGALELPDVRQAELGREVRVLAVGLLDPAPPRVARDVEDRAQRVAGAGRQHPPADRAGHPADEVGVERGRPRRSTAGSTARPARAGRGGDSSWMMAGIPRRVSSTRKRWIAFAARATSGARRFVEPARRVI